MLIYCILHDPIFSYPPEAIENKEFDRISVKISINEQGRVKDAKIIRGCFN
jgi:hypothetical protein